MTDIETRRVKLLFEVENDDETTEIESLWALPVIDGYKLDNIPFYAKEVAYNDIVSAERCEDGQLRYSELLVASEHSTVRLWFADESNVAAVRDHLRRMGCASELDLSRLVAVDVPPVVPYVDVQSYLNTQEEAGVLEYEEACLGQR